jgi:hypothetical protein
LILIFIVVAIVLFAAYPAEDILAFAASFGLMTSMHYFYRHNFPVSEWGQER